MIHFTTALLIATTVFGLTAVAAYNIAWSLAITTADVLTSL